MDKTRWAILLPVDIYGRDRTPLQAKAVDVLLNMKGASWRRMRRVYVDFDGSELWETEQPDVRH